MILVLVPLVGIGLGVGLWAILRGLGLLNVLGAEPDSFRRGPRDRRTPTNFRERVEDIPQAWLIGVIAVSGLWILGWLIVLIVGLTLLS